MAEPLAPLPSSAEPLPAPTSGRGAWARRGVWAALGVLVLGVAGVEVGFRRSALRQGLVAENHYLAKARAFEEGPGADIAMTGDSRILYGFDAGVVSDAVEEARGERLRVYNAGLSGAPPMAQLAWVRRLLTHPRRPRLVLLGLSPYMFSSRIAYQPSRESLTTLWRLRDVPTAVRAGAGLEELSTVIVSDLFELVRLRPRVLEVVLHGKPVGGPAELGEDGFLRMGGVDPWTQAARAHGRGLAYRTELWRPEARFGNEHVGYFLEALRLLRAEGVTTLVVNTPSASQLDAAAYGPHSLYDEHIAWVKATAARYGARYVDAQRVPGVADADFTDGDHLSGPGAARFSEWLARTHVVPALGGERTGEACRPLFTFDEGGLTGWTLTGEAGDALQAGPAPGQQPLHGVRGQGLFNTFTRRGDEATGEALSPPFALEGGRLRLRVGGGAGPGVEVALRVDGREVAMARGRNAEVLSGVTWELGAVKGRTGVLRIRDDERGPWGHLLVDDVRLCP